MKLKVLVVDLEIPPRVKKWGLRIGIPAVILGIATVAYAGLPVTWTAGQTLTAADLNSNFTYLQGEITALQGMPASVPTGTIIAYAGSTTPSGWLPCDGSSLDGTTTKYAALFAAIGIAYGGNTTSMQFNLPDLRGRFVRGWDHGAGHDPEATLRVFTATGGNTGDAVGTQQADEVQSHNHGVSDPGHAHTTAGFLDSTNAIGGGTSPLWGTFSPAPGTPPTGAATTGISIQSFGGPETRPFNISVNYIIKY